MNQKTKRARGAPPPSPFTPEDWAAIQAAERSMGFSDRLNERLAGEQEEAKEAHAFDEARAADARVEQAAAKVFGPEDAAEVAHVTEDERGPVYAAAAQPFPAETKETTMTKFERAVIAVIVVALLGTAWACRYETLRIGREGVLRINRWTGRKYIEYPQFDSDGMKWIVAPGERPTPPPPANQASASTASTPSPAPTTY